MWVVEALDKVEDGATGLSRRCDALRFLSGRLRVSVCKIGLPQEVLVSRR